MPNVDLRWDYALTEKALLITDSKTLEWQNPEEVPCDGWTMHIGRGNKLAMTDKLLQNGRFKISFQVSGFRKYCGLGVGFYLNGVTWKEQPIFGLRDSCFTTQMDY
jgi:hypothetical protein